MPYNLLAIAHLHHAFANHYQPLADSHKVDWLTAFRPSKWYRSKLNKIEVIDTVMSIRILVLLYPRK